MASLVHLRHAILDAVSVRRFIDCEQERDDEGSGLVVASQLLLHGAKGARCITLGLLSHNPVFYLIRAVNFMLGVF